MATKKKVEIFSAGCRCCDETIQMLKRIASDHDVVVHDMKKSDVAGQATRYGIHRVPAVVIDGKLAECCKARGLEEDVLRSALA